MTVLQGRNALVTGASSGLGADFARVLAGRGCNLVLVARREDRLKELADELTSRHHVDAHVVPTNLTGPDAPQMLHDRVHEMGLAVDVLINNAGFGTFGPFVDIPWERERELLELDIVTLVHLTKLFVRDMVARSSGWVLQVSSIGAFQPSPTYASYSAAKAFVLSFGEALGYELRKSNVKVSVLCPGVTATEFLRVAGQSPTLYQRLFMMKSREVAEIGIRAMLAGRRSVVAGRLNTLMAWSQRLLPRRLQAAMASAAMQYGPR